MVKFFKFLFLCTHALVWASSSRSQDFDDFGPDDSSAKQAFKKKKKSSSPLFEFWKKSGKGTIGSARVIGPDTNRGYSFLDLRLDHTFSTETKLVLAGIIEYADVLINIKLRPSEEGRQNGITRDAERKFKYDATNLRPQELYIKQDLLKTASLSYGFQKVVLGQFEPFSPNNFAMPWNLSSLATNFNKTENTLPQQVAIVDLYPIDQAQLSLYYFPHLTYDRLVAEELDDILARETNTRQTLALPKGSNAAQKMARLVFYPSWGIIGFTYYNGYHSSFPVAAAKIRQVPTTTLYEEYDKTWTFAKNEMFSIEAAVPVGRFTYKVEYARHKDSEDLSSRGYNADTPEGHELANAILLTNQGSTNIPFIRDIAAIGFTADLKRWHINFMIMYMGQRYKGNAKRLKNLEEEAKKSTIRGEEDDGMLPLAPGFVASYYLDSDRQNELGLAGGILGPGFGAMLFYRKQADSFTYGAGLQAISYFSNDSIKNSLPEGYELSNDMTVGMTLSMGYRF